MWESHHLWRVYHALHHFEEVLLALARLEHREAHVVIDQGDVVLESAGLDDWTNPDPIAFEDIARLEYVSMVVRDEVDCHSGRTLFCDERGVVQSVDFVERHLHMGTLSDFLARCQRGA